MSLSLSEVSVKNHKNVKNIMKTVFRSAACTVTRCPGGGGVSHYSDYTAESEVSTTHIDIEVFLGEAFCAFLMDSVTRFLVLHGFYG